MVNETEVDRHSIGVEHTAKMYDPFIIVGVAYLSMVDESARHCSTFIYRLSRIDPQRPSIALPFIKGESIPAFNLSLTRARIAPIIK